MSSFQNFLLYTCAPRRWAAPGRCKTWFCLLWKFGSKWSRGCPAPDLGGLQMPPCCCHSSCGAGADKQVQHSFSAGLQHCSFGTLNSSSSMPLHELLLPVAVQGKRVVRNLLEIVLIALNWDYLLFCPVDLIRQTSLHHFCASHRCG